MKIIILGPAHPYRGGIADTNESLCEAFNTNGHDASIITFKVQYPDLLFPGKSQFKPESRPPDLKIDRMIHSLNPANWFRVAGKINKMQPDLVIVRYWMPFFAPSMGSVVRLLDRKITTIAMCDNVIPHESRPGDGLLTRYFISAFDGFITLSQTTLKELDQFTTKPKTSYPHPINTNLGEKMEKSAAREYLDLDPEGKYLLFFGLIRDYKGLDLTLQALARPEVQSQNIQLIVAGEFYEPKAKYETLIDHLHIRDRVTLIDQFIPTGELTYYFSAADLVIQTYKTASQSGVSQMAYHFECPILVTDVGGLAEVVHHQHTGYVTQKDPADIAKYIAEYFQEDRMENFQKSMRAEKYKYSWPSFTEELLNLYNTIRKNGS